MAPPVGTIKHLVVLMLANRSFDHMLGFLKSDDYPIEGLTGTESNLDANDVAVTVTNDAMYSGDLNPDPGHHFTDVTMQIFGNPDGAGAPTMSGFVKAYAQMGGSSIKQSHKIMKCYAPSKIPILTTLAQTYAICDHWFSSVPGPTLPNRSYAHAATSMGRLDMNPIWINEAKTIYELLAESDVSSKIYFHDATMAMTFKNFLKNQKFFGRLDEFLDACKNNKLPAYSFVEPRYNADDVNNLPANDQHPDHDVAEGEILIRDVYNAIRNNDNIWNSTVLLVTYDCHGGLYDHVPPPQGVPNPDDKNSSDPPFDFTRLGVRVPAVIISAWTDPVTIDSTRYEHSSIAATARKLFLGGAWQTKFLTERDRTANTFDRVLTRDTPRNDVPDFHRPSNLEALARASDSQSAANRAAQFAARPLSELQKTLALQTYFVNQNLNPELQSNIKPHEIQTERQAAALHNEVLGHVVPLKDIGENVVKSATSARTPLESSALLVGPSTHVARDRWTIDDSLGYFPYAYAIYRFLTDKDTKPPLAISIQAPWGGGKTSLMRMIQAQLDPTAIKKLDKFEATNPEVATVADVIGELGQPISKNKDSATGSQATTPFQVPAMPQPRETRATVWFNAWKYESTSQVWAGLADSIVKQLTERLGPLQRELFWFRLQLRRVDAGMVRQKLYEEVKSRFVQRVLPWLWAYIAGPAISAFVVLLGWLLKSPLWSHIGGFATLAAVMSNFVAASKQWTTSKAETEKQPARVTLGEFVKAPDYTANLGFVHQVAEDLKRTFDLVPEQDRPVVIFIDDLDRCSPNKVADVIEAINLFLAGEFPYCMFVLGIDDEMVAAALDKAHSDVISRLPAYAKSNSIGWRFMDKFVQLPFIVPPPSPEDINRYTQSLFSRQGTVLNMKLITQVVNVIGTQDDKHESAEAVADKVAEEHKLSPIQKEKLSKEAQKIDDMDRQIKNFSDEEETIKELILNAASKFSINPRDIKRFVNVFRFYYFLRAAREARKEPVPSSQQLISWIVLSLKWPEAVRGLRRSHLASNDSTPSHLQRLEQAAGQSRDLTDWTQRAASTFGMKAEEGSWLHDQEMFEFFSDQAKRKPEERVSFSAGKGLW